MKKAIGIIVNVDGDNADLNELLQHRSISTLDVYKRQLKLFQS